MTAQLAGPRLDTRDTQDTRDGRGAGAQDTENAGATPGPRSLRADGTVFPPVTPDPPAPPGYRSPLDDSPALADLAGAADRHAR